MFHVVNHASLKETCRSIDTDIAMTPRITCISGTAKTVSKIGSKYQYTYPLMCSFHKKNNICCSKIVSKYKNNAYGQCRSWHFFHFHLTHVSHSFWYICWIDMFSNFCVWWFIISSFCHYSYRLLNKTEWAHTYQMLTPVEIYASRPIGPPKTAYDTATWDWLFPPIYQTLDEPVDF